MTTLPMILSWVYYIIQHVAYFSFCDCLRKGCVPYAALKILWRYFVLTDRDARPFSLDNYLKEKLTDATIGLGWRTRKCAHRLEGRGCFGRGMAGY
jgi:hypothetical protein